MCQVCPIINSYFHKTKNLHTVNVQLTIEESIYFLKIDVSRPFRTVLAMIYIYIAVKKYIAFISLQAIECAFINEQH